MRGGSALSEESSGRRREVQRFRRRVRTSHPRNRGQVCGGRSEFDGRRRRSIITGMWCGSRSEDVRVFGIGRHRKSAAEVGESGNKETKAEDASVDMSQG